MTENFFNTLILISLVLTITIILTVIIRKAITRYLNNAKERLNIDPTNFIFFKNSITFIIFLGGAIVLFNKVEYLKSLGNAVFASAGILAAIVGFASQKAISNLIGGLFILFFRPFRVGDVIQVKDGHVGTVEELTLRHTVIKNFENERIIIPNATIGDETVINVSITDEKVRQHYKLLLDYNADINQAFKVLNKLVLELPYLIDNRTEKDLEKGVPLIEILVTNLTELGVEIKVFMWHNNNADAFKAKCALNLLVKNAFDKEGIKFSYRNSLV